MSRRLIDGLINLSSDVLVDSFHLLRLICSHLVIDVSFSYPSFGKVMQLSFVFKGRGGVRLDFCLFLFLGGS